MRGVESQQARPPSGKPAAGYGSAVVSCLLILMGLAAFAPCVLLPEWRAYQAMQLAQQAEQHRLDSLQRVVDRERRLLDALQSDPAVIARAAQRELGFYEPGSLPVRVPVTPTGTRQDEEFVPEPVTPPPILTHMASYLPAFNYDSVFCDDHTRYVIMAMSVALIVVAMCLPSRRSSPHKDHRQ